MVSERAKLHIALTFLQFCHAGNHIFLRIALNTGVSKLVFPVYRNITAFILLAPLAYFTEKYIHVLSTLPIANKYYIVTIDYIVQSSHFFVLCFYMFTSL